MARNTIVLKGRGIRKEGVAGGAITPGHLISRDANDELVVHAVAAGTAAPTFAVENEVIGKGIDDAYAANDQVLYEHVQPGSEVYALVAAAAAAIVVGDYLESAGDGTLRKVAVSAATAQSSRNSVVARAIEAVDNSAGGAAARIMVETL